MSEPMSYAQHEQVRGGPRKSSNQPSEHSWPWNFLKKAPSKAEHNKSALLPARNEQASRETRGSESSHTSKAPNKSRTLQEGDGVTDNVDNHPRNKRSRPPSASSVNKWIFSASLDELLAKSPPELAKALLNLRVEVEQLKAANQQWEMTGTICNKDSQSTEPIERCRQLEKDLARMKKELEQERANSAETEKAKRRALKSLALMTKTDPYNFDDKHFENSIKTLRYSVAHWVRNQSWRLAEHPSIRFPIGSDRYKFLKGVSEHYKSYTDSKRGLESILQAHIWRFFLLKIFGQDVWGEVKEQETDNMLTYWKLKRHLEKTVSNKYAELRHEWRVVSARILAARRSESVGRGLDNMIKDLCLSMESNLRGIVHKRPDVKGLEDLVREAVDLDAIMQQQRPSYRFFPDVSDPPKPLKLIFCESTMDIVDYDDREPLPTNQQIKLVLAPGLWRYGNSAGKEYNKRSCILRAEVDINGDASY